MGYYPAAVEAHEEARVKHRAERQVSLRLSIDWLLERMGVMNANNPLFYDATVQASVDAVAALLNSGFIKIYTGTQPSNDGSITGTLLATLTFGATAFGASSASGGTVTATANTITSGTAGNTGTAGYFALEKSNGTTVVATGSVGTSSADLVLNSLSITSGATVSCSSFTITEAQT